MFGHDDNSDKNTPQSTALPPTDITPVAPIDDTASDSPVVTATDSPTSEHSFIATDLDGQPDPTSSTVTSSAHDDDLLKIKQQALQQLSPLVGHLNQTPEEKFRTTMMMIQASDDQSLVNRAYEAAKDISDEKTRAQALLDIINEINYFTQQQDA